MRSKKILREARILPGAVRYQVWSLTLTCILVIFAIPLLPIIVPLAIWGFRRYYARLEVVLTQRDLLVRRGIINHEEKTIPLEKITDLAIFQGPLMRVFGIKGIRVETAGQSTGGALVRVFGIENVEDFRDAVLEQRDRISDSDEEGSSTQAPSPDSDTLGVLTSIRDSLARIEKQLGKDRAG